jgi:hypothetical protein
MADTDKHTIQSTQHNQRSYNSQRKLTDKMSDKVKPDDDQSLSPSEKKEDQRCHLKRRKQRKL